MVQLKVGDFGFDLSRGWSTITVDEIVATGAKFAIVYAGCDDTTKNISQTRFNEYRSKLAVALVIENSATSLQGGKPIGQAQGAKIVAAAESLGYDRATCVLFASADWNSQSQADLSDIQQAMLGFSESVSVPGLYGNSFALNLERIEGWQSESQSFSDGVSQYAVLLQKFNDPRAGGLDVDVNVIQHLPLHFMGETMSGPTDASIQQDVATELNKGTAPGQLSWAGTEQAILGGIQTEYNRESVELADLATVLANQKALADALNNLTTLVNGLTAGGTYSGSASVTVNLTKSA